LKTDKCIVCGKAGCVQCFPHLMNMLWGSFAHVETFRVCSDQCQETFAKRVEKEITPSRIRMNARKIPIGKFVIYTMRVNKFHVSEELSEILKGKSSMDERIRRTMVFPKMDSNLWIRLEKTGNTIKAETLEKVRRFEEAAKVYEQIGMFEKAGKARAKDRQVAVRRTEVSVDLNSLLKQIRDGGIVAVYRCPHCGGKLKVGKETSVKSLKVCEHCGSEIKAMELADFLKTVLS